MKRIFIILLLITFLLIVPAWSMNVCIICDWENDSNKFFSLDSNPEQTYKPFYLLKKSLEPFGVHCCLLESDWDLIDADYVICLNYPRGPGVLKRMIELKSRDKLILFLFEPPVTDGASYDPRGHRPFGKIYTWDDSLVDHKKYFKFYYPVRRTPMLNQRVPFQRKKLCTMISGNKKSKHHKELYSARVEAIEFFENNHPSDFEFYGKGWPKNKYQTYGGVIDEKASVLSRYRFSICYENMKDVQGYVTEKIFDCFHAGCVPIYWGASNIFDYIPAGCFIDRRDFESLEELYRFLSEMTEQEYQGYLKNIREYLESNQSYPFSAEHFVEFFKASVIIPNKLSPASKG